MSSSSSSATRVTYVTVLPVICALGLAGNIVSVGVLLRPRFRRAAIFVFLRAMAVSDAVHVAFTIALCYLVADRQ